MNDPYRPEAYKPEFLGGAPKGCAKQALFVLLVALLVIVCISAPLIAEVVNR